MQFYERALVSYNQVADTPKKKNYFEIAATLVLLIALIVMIYPAITHILELNKEITAGKVVQESLIEKKLALDNAKANLAAIQNDLPVLEAALPTGSDIKTYIKKPLEDLTSKHNLTLNSVQFTDLPISSPGDTNLVVRNMDFTVSVQGDFTNFNDFLSDLEKFIRVTSVATIDIKNNNNSISATLNATTNYLGSPILVKNQVGGQ